MSTKRVVAGKYQLGDVIGEGGMGTVYLARDLRSRRRVAIKQLKPEVIASEPGILTRFRREGEALRRLNHPNIVRVQRILNEGVAHYIVMEYVDGGSLAELIQREGQLPLDRVLRIALELSDALARAHHLHIIHRDLKPANVLMARDDSTRLTDFGIAYMEDRSRLTQTHTVMGTLTYLSPEALDGRSLDTRADIWSLGVVIYQMLTGRLPFEETTPAATISAIYHKTMPSIMHYRPDLPPALVALVEGMLQKDIQRRIASARRVGAELYSIIEGTASLYEPPPPTPMDSAEDESASAMLLRKVILELVALKEEWEGRAIDMQARVRAIPSNNQESRAYHRGLETALRTVAQELGALLEESREEIDDEPEAVYAAVDISAVKDLLTLAGLNYSNLYEDRGPVFSVIFRTMMQMSLPECIERMREHAPGIVILESGRLPDTREPFIDFAFSTPL